MKDFFKNALIGIVMIVFVVLMGWRYISGFLLDLSIWDKILGIFGL